jgi:hypothetical protein
MPHAWVSKNSKLPQPAEVNQMQVRWSERIAQIAGLTAQEARDALMSQIEKEVAADACKLSRRILDSAQSSAQERRSVL